MNQMHAIITTANAQYAKAVMVPHRSYPAGIREYISLALIADQARQACSSAPLQYLGALCMSAPCKTQMSPARCTSMERMRDTGVRLLYATDCFPRVTGANIFTRKVVLEKYSQLDHANARWAPCHPPSGFHPPSPVALSPPPRGPFSSAPRRRQLINEHCGFSQHLL
jgi:hypothetical protein